MRRGFLIIVVLAFVIGAGATAALTTPKGIATVWPYLPKSMQMRPSFYLQYALRIIQQRSAKGGTVEWPDVIAHAKDLAKDATTPADTYPAIRYALEQLKDGASTLTPLPTAGDGAPQGVFGFMTLYPEKVVAVVYPESAAAAAGIKAGDQIELVNGAPPVASTESRNRGYFVNIPPPSAKLRIRHPADKDARDVSLTVGGFTPLPALARRLGGDLGYVEIPATNGAEQFAERVRESIFQSDAPTVCGWIVDLRFNNGGEKWAMLQTLRPILGEPPLGAFDAADGTRTSWIYPTSGAFALAKPDQELSHPKAPVAVLTSRLTARAGELTAIAFRGRPDTRSFGEPTWGAPFETTAFVLADGARLDLATAKAADRTSRVYDSRIEPDQAVTIDWSKLTAQDDPVVIAAGTWLRTMPGCKK